MERASAASVKWAARGAAATHGAAQSAARGAAARSASDDNARKRSGMLSSSTSHDGDAAASTERVAARATNASPHAPPQRAAVQMPSNAPLYSTDTASKLHKFRHIKFSFNCS